MPHHWCMRAPGIARVATLVAAGFLLLGCAPAATPTPAPQSGAPTAASSTAALTPPASIVPVPSEGYFAFDAESILGYYALLGYACGEAQPSTQAAGYTYRSCQLVDTDGRTRVVGIVTDPAGDVADAFTSVTGTTAETILDPGAVLDPFAAFLGAMLGEAQGVAMLEWLAGHLGDEYATTTLGDLTLATYTESPDDHSRLYIEIANPAYLDAATPVPSS